MGITLGVADRSKLGGDECSGHVLSGGKVEGRSLVELLWVKYGISVGPCYGISDGRDLWNIEFGSWKRKIDRSPLGDSLGAYSGSEGGSSGEI